MQAMTEEQWLRQVIDLCAALGWTPYHVNKSGREVTFHKGQRHERRAWVSNVNLQGKGFPDLVLVRERILYRELKRDGEHATPEQVVWGERITRAGGDFAVWHPADYDTVERTLR